MLLWPLIILKI